MTSTSGGAVRMNGVVAALILVPTLAGCGGSGGGNHAPLSSPTASPSPTALATPTPSATPSATPTPPVRPTPTATPTPSLEGFSGQVDGSGPRNPIDGASVTLYAMGNKGYGTGAAILATAVSGSDGRFHFRSRSTCPDRNPPTYAIATGGDAGSGTNTAIGLIALTGPCASLSPSSFVTLNPLTAVAAEYALAQFSDSTGTDFGTSSTNRRGLNNAVNQAQDNLVMSYLETGGDASNTGVPASFLPWTSGSSSCTSAQNCDGLERLNTLANVIASCIGTSGPLSAQCGALFSATGVSTTTLAAMHSIATSPASSVTAIYALQGTPATAPFQPALATAPGDFTLALSFNPGGNTFSFPQNLAIDVQGHVWVTSGDTVTELTAGGALAGSFDNSNPAGANFDDPTGVAIDPSGHVWVANEGNDTVTELTISGGLLGNFNPAGANFDSPTGVAIDASSDVWVPNFGGGTVTRLNSSGGLLGNFNPGGNTFVSPNAVAIDGSGHAWVADYGGNTAIELDSSGALVAIFSKTNPAGAYFNNPLNVAIDGSGNAWVISTGDAVTELTASGGLAGNFNNSNPAGANFDFPIGVAIDGSGDVWVTNSAGGSDGDGSVTELSGSGALKGNFNPAGADFDAPSNAAIDESGDVWVTNSSGNTVAELIGAARPVKTPRVACLTEATPVAVCRP